MPELPEVETVRRDLNKLVRGQKITALRIIYTRMIKSDLTEFKTYLINQTIHEVNRRGKYLLFDLGEQTMVSHLRMEGKWLSYPSNDMPDNKHFHGFFDLSNGQTLVYQDVRKFGTMELVKTAELADFFSRKKIGPEPTETDFDLKTLQHQLSGSQKKIKPYLLDQSLVAGLGNIYVDEVLWLAKIHPSEISRHLSPKKVAELRRSVIYILAEGVKHGGSTIRSYKNALGLDGTMQNYLQVYGKTGQPCARCGTPIKKYKLAGRGTHFCPKCQKLKKV
ncbi:DNA-formamidopyrimidine glycosylase [Pseudolactococcus yaeyamensis]